MIRRRYRIEANILTLKRFVDILSEWRLLRGFVQRLTCDSNEEYYYVVVIADARVHTLLKEQRFTDSIPLKD